MSVYDEKKSKRLMTQQLEHRSMKMTMPEDPPDHLPEYEYLCSVN
jgi:hypothetical protein